MAAQEVLSGSLEMWLPSEFLGDDFFLEEKMYRRAQAAMEASPAIFSPNPDSPPDSATETEESDEEEFVAGLTTQMARSSLGFGPSPVPATTARRKASPFLSCSPQSPLCSAWPDTKGPPSQVPSHPEDVWERLCLRNTDEIEQQKLTSGFLFPPRRVSPPCPVPQKSAATIGGGYYYGHENPHRSFQLEQHLKQQQQHLKPQQLLRQQLSAAWSRQNRIRAATAGLSHMTHGRAEGGHPSLGPARLTWPPLQQPPPHSAGMRAVFLSSGSGGARKQSSGTGVFLPRRVGSPTEPRKKPACSTVLVPAKVVQALNLNLDDMGLPPHFNSKSRTANGFFFDRELLLNARTGATLPQKRTAVARSPPNHLTVNPEARLPPEWTY